MPGEERKSPHSFAGRSDEELKKAAAWKACEYIKSDQVVGLGTGSTAAFAVDRIAQLIKQGKLKNIVGIPTSIKTYEQAKSLGIPLSTLDEHPHIHVAIGESMSMLSHPFFLSALSSPLH
jgi:ribose 5-phosphate isomerase